MLPSAESPFGEMGDTHGIEVDKRFATGYQCGGVLTHQVGVIFCIKKDGLRLRCLDRKCLLGNTVEHRSAMPQDFVLRVTVCALARDGNGGVFPQP